MAGHVKIRNEKLRKRLRARCTIRLRITGTAERPRLSVFRSARYVYAQAIDDTTGRVLAAASELEAHAQGRGRRQAQEGARAARRQGDRREAQGAQHQGGRVRPQRVHLHGRVKEVADGARDAGLQF